MCAKIRDNIPRESPPKLWATKTNKSIRETPVTISGLTIGRLVTFIIMRRTHLLRIPLSPMAATVPSTVATAAATTAMISVFLSASIIMRSSNRRAYHRSEKPENTERLIVSESLKEKIIKTKIGAYRKRKTRKVYTFDATFISSALPRAFRRRRTDS